MSKIAEFRMIGRDDYGIRSIWREDRMCEGGTIPGYVRTSDWIEVAFQPRTDDAAIPEELAQLDAKLEEIKADFANKVNAIEDAKAKLLAVTDQRELA